MVLNGSWLKPAMVFWHWFRGIRKLQSKASTKLGIGTAILQSFRLIQIVKCFCEKKTFVWKAWSCCSSPSFGRWLTEMCRCRGSNSFAITLKTLEYFCGQSLKPSGLRSQLSWKMICASQVGLRSHLALYSCIERFRSCLCWNWTLLNPD